MVNTNSKSHPKGLWVLFLTEMWERFGYYLMLGIFSLYMLDGWNNGGMGFSPGKKSDIYRLGEKSYMVTAQEDANEVGGFVHSGAFILVDQNRHVRGIYDGTKEEDVNHLIEDIDLISNQNIIKNRSIIINIITSDPLVPIMKLIGGNTVNLLLGNPYTDLGVTITDYFGTTITSYNLIGSVDSNTLGLYLLTYSATDNRSSTINQIRYVYVNNSTVYSSLFFWIDPSDLNTINYNNTSIVSITDKSGTNIVLTQYTSTSIPQLKLNGINGLPVLDLTNSSSLKSINTYANSYNVTLAVVVTFFQTTNWGVIWGHFNNHDSDITLRNTAGSVYINWHTNNDNSNVQIPYIANTPVLYLATLTNGTSRWLQVINLITGNTNTISGTNSLTMTLANCPFYLGSSEVTSELALCYIGECMYWKRVLNGSELLQVKSYLYNKWSLNNIKNFINCIT